MNKTLETIITSLDDLALSIKNAYADDRTMAEVWGWNFPALNRHDLAEIATNISVKIKNSQIVEIEKDVEDIISDIPARINIFKAHTLPYLFNGHGKDAAPNYFSLIDWIESVIYPLFSWETLQDNKALPKELNRRLRSIQSELTNIVPDKEKLQSQINLIEKATEAAELLPTDLETLKEAKKKVDKFSLDAAELYGKIDTFHKNSDKTAQSILDKKIEADKLVEQCEEAYKITTTKGLAASFDERANKLSNTMWIWVAGLLGSLIVGGLIGSSRFETLADALKDTNPNWGVIWMDFMLSVVGLAAPVWFAWIATKQINQRFRLAEDYAFKASVAKAYEGYRKEAARIDSAFESRLFSSALSRLEEAPLRLVENDYHSSPWQEFMNSPAFAKAITSVPELKNELLSSVKNGTDILKDKIKVKKQTDLETE